MICCKVKYLPGHLAVGAAARAAAVNPLNAPPASGLAALGISLPQHIAAMTTKYWRSGGVHLTVGFMEDTPADLAARIIAHMNAWGTTANVLFLATATDPQVRISREGDGYWSYVGTDILSIPAELPTLNLEGFTMDTPDSEFRRVVRHEAGHTLGFCHEHLRRELVDRIDPEKAIERFLETEGWSSSETRAQVLTPVSARSIFGTPPDVDSIMCYQLPGSITRDGLPIPGGLDIDESDHAFAARVYPKR